MKQRAPIAGRQYMRLLNHLLPPVCYLCGAPCCSDAHLLDALICHTCREGLAPPVHGNRCSTCSIPIPQFIEQCERCRRESFSFDRAFALHRYSGLPAKLIGAFKFGGHRSLARPIGAAMADSAAVLAPLEIPLVPVPSQRKSIARRGFAGAHLIAVEIARRTGRPMRSLLRAAPGRSQKTLRYEERRRNALATIEIAGAREIPRVLILVDDIFTTGTTAETCTRRLREAGAEHVFVLAFALDY